MVYFIVVVMAITKMDGSPTMTLRNSVHQDGELLEIRQRYLLTHYEPLKTRLE